MVLNVDHEWRNISPTLQCNLFQAVFLQARVSQFVASISLQGLRRQEETSLPRGREATLFVCCDSHEKIFLHVSIRPHAQGTQGRLYLTTLNTT